MNINMIATPWVYKMICWTVLILWALQSRRFALFLLKKNALIFMDEPTYRGSEYLLNIRVPNPKTARIPAPEARGCQELMRPVGQVINCVWVGRLADFKISILIYLSASLERYNQQNGKRVKLTVIGSGPKEAELRQNVAELANLTVDFISDLGLGELNLYLQNHTDILFAMGTSALEGAASGVPTVLLDFSYKKVPEGYVYRWLHDTEGSSLGDWISSANIRSGNQSLATIMIELQTNTQELKKKTLEYVQKYHDLKTVSRQILDFSVKTEASYQSLVQEGLFKQGLIYSLLRRIRSIRNKRNV